MSASAGPSRPIVLVVDDDSDIQEVLHHTLGARGFQVLIASDTDTALAVCRQRLGTIQVLLADLSLPGDLDGSLARRVAAEFPEIRTIFVTSVPRYIAVGTGLVAPDAPYLEKPIHPDVLAGMIRNTLTRHNTSGSVIS